MKWGSHATPPTKWCSWRTGSWSTEGAPAYLFGPRFQRARAGVSLQDTVRGCADQRDGQNGWGERDDWDARDVSHAARLCAVGRRCRGGRGFGWRGAAAFRLRACGRRAARRHEDRRARLRASRTPRREGVEGLEVDVARELAARGSKGDPNALEIVGVNVTTRGAMLDNGTLDATLATFPHHRCAQEDLRFLAALLYRPYRCARAEEVGHHRFGGP